MAEDDMRTSGPAAAPLTGDTAFHSIDLDTDEDGWWYATCACGWQRGPFPGREDAADAYGDHRAGGL